MPIGICLQFFIRRHARRIGAFRKCERIGRGFAKRLAGSGSPKFERWRSQLAGQSPTQGQKKGAKPEVADRHHVLLLSAGSSRSLKLFCKDCAAGRPDWRNFEHSYRARLRREVTSPQRSRGEALCESPRRPPSRTLANSIKRPSLVILTMRPCVGPTSETISSRRALSRIKGRFHGEHANGMQGLHANRSKRPTQCKITVLHSVPFGAVEC